MENAFTVKSNCSNASVIVLDDIVTTGATLAAAKAALVNAGFKQITFVTFTSIPKSDSSSY
jgi:predicted amidophosphoribosyltransferase